MAALVVVVSAAALVIGRSTRATATPRPPMLGPARVAYAGDLGDPFILPVATGGSVTGYVAFGTGDWPDRIPTAHSPTLRTCRKGPAALPDLPRAPAVLDNGHGYVLYVTLPDARSGRQCIGVASAPTPEGPYAAVGDGPLVCQLDLGGSIDPSVVRDGAGQLHLLWKDESNTRGRASGLWSQPLRADGLALTGAPHR